MISAIGSTHAFAPPRRALALIPRFADSPSVDRFEASSLAALPLDPTPTARPEARWHKDQIIYFPMTDRFQDGDPTNNYLVRRDDPTGFWGGDLAGLTQKLDYIKSLGATTIWLSPVADNANELTIGDYHGYGHHGYWIADHEKVEEHQGSLDTAQRLVEEAHKRGLKVVLDVVLNQVAPTHPFVADPNKHDWFHHHGEIKNWEDPYETVYGDLGGLPDLAQENPATYDYLLNNTVDWVRKLGVDGVRLDAVKHIQKEVWQRFVPDLKAKLGDDLFVMGEVFHGDPHVVADYQRAGIDYLFDLPLYYTIREVFGQGQSMARLGERLDQDGLYPDASKLVTVLDNHDLPRFLHSAGDRGRDRLKQAMAFLMTVRGVPSVYYGTEVGLEGGHDPDNRRMMDFDRDPDLRHYFSQLTELRNHSDALRRGAQREMWRDDKVYAFSRTHEQEEVIAVFHNGDHQTSRSIPLRAESPLKEGTLLRDQISGREVRVSQGRLNVELDPLQAAIFEVVA